MIAMMSLQDVGRIIESNGFVTVSDRVFGSTKNVSKLIGSFASQVTDVPVFANLLEHHVMSRKAGIFRIRKIVWWTLTRFFVLLIPNTRSRELFSQGKWAEAGQGTRRPRGGSSEVARLKMPVRRGYRVRHEGIAE